MSSSSAGREWEGSPLREGDPVAGDLGHYAPDPALDNGRPFGAAHRTPSSSRNNYSSNGEFDPVVEPAPNTVFYRAGAQQHVASRPTIRDLRFSVYKGRNLGEEMNEVSPSEPSGAKFGLVDGVVVGCLLNIWGVILFLRLGWVIGTAGIGLGSLVMILAMSVTTVTTLSLSAICTNGEVKGGGAYYLISRALGPSFGGAIGLIFFVANAVAVALYLVGFAETVAGISNSDLFGGRVSWDIRVYGILGCLFLFFVAMIGVAWVVKMQSFLLLTLVLSMLMFLIGTFTHHDYDATGFTGYSSATFRGNFGPSEGFGLSKFFEVFGVFFPAVTGIMAGANISGDLKDPQHAIPKGTLIAIGISGVSYIIMGWCIGAVVVRETVPGDTGSAVGLLNDYLVFQKVSAVEALVVVGIFAATLSSALASLVGAPRVLQSLTSDRLFPALNLFSAGYGPNNEPVRGYVATLVIVISMVLVGDLNTIAALITNFFLLAYALVNLSCFCLSYWHAPGWRPTFHWYSMWISLGGAVVCVAVMFLISWVTAVITILSGAALFIYLHYSRPDVNWGSAGQSRAYLSATRLLVKLGGTREHVKTFRPSFLVMTGHPAERADLVTAVAYFNKKGKGAVFCGNVIVQKREKGTAESWDELRKARADPIEQELLLLPAFYECVMAQTVRDGFQSLLQLCGVGRLRPNTVVLGWKAGWREADTSETSDYVGMISDTLDLDLGVAILRPTLRTDLPDSPVGSIDVWWLGDDGGLTLLLPFILQSHDHWRQCPLRVLTMCKTSADVEQETTRMGDLLRKFRIAAKVVVVPRNDPSAGSDAEVSESLNSFLSRAPGSATAENSAGIVRTGSVLRKASSECAMAFVTMPVPGYEVDPLLYMAWLEEMSRDMPPLVFIRGNQSSVLTHVM